MSKKKRSRLLRIVLRSLSAIVVLAIVAGVVAYAVIFRGWRPSHLFPAHQAELSFDGDSSELTSTEVVATLDTPLTPGKNAIWCASFLAAWKKLDKVTGEPPTLEGDPPAVALLNSASDPTGDLPEDSYTQAGFVDKGILDTIRSDMARLFPERHAPEFPGIVPDSFVAYAYLEANISFSIPYLENRKPLLFKESETSRKWVHSFGIRSEDEHAYADLRKQPAVLYEKRDGDVFEFAVDLCRDSQPNQVVVACIEKRATLAEALDFLASVVRDEGSPEARWGLHDIDQLLVPDIFWRIRHGFSDLEGKNFSNRALSGQRLDVALQDTTFNLNRSGARVMSESKVYALGEYDPRLYHADRPFLVYMKKRGAERPFFVMWVDNAELLQKWEDE